MCHNFKQTSSTIFHGAFLYLSFVKYNPLLLNRNFSSLEIHVYHILIYEQLQLNADGFFFRQSNTRYRRYFITITTRSQKVVCAVGHRKQTNLSMITLHRFQVQLLRFTFLIFFYPTPMNVLNLFRSSSSLLSLSDKAFTCYADASRKKFYSIKYSDGHGQ